MPNCQICKYISDLEESPVVRQTSINDILDGNVKLPYSNRNAWQNIQKDCKDLRRAFAHLTQGTRPSKKKTHELHDVKRYLQYATIASDGLLVVRQQKPFSSSQDRIIVPRNIISGIVTAIHLKLDHPSKHQLKQVMNRYFFALNMDKEISSISKSCYQCQSLQKVPHALLPQSTSQPPTRSGDSFAADVIKGERQLILVVRENITTFTVASLIENETARVVGDKLIELCTAVKTLGDGKITIRTDAAPCFVALQNIQLLKQHGIEIEIGRIKNPNKNPIAEKAIQELIQEILIQQPQRGPINSLILSLACSRLNSRIRKFGLSARESWTGRDQYTNERLQIDDAFLIENRYHQRLNNHTSSEKSKAPLGKRYKHCDLNIGDIVYLHIDGNKYQARDRYIVKSIDKDFCSVVKLSGNNIRRQPYKVKKEECYTVSSQIPSNLNRKEDTSDESNYDFDDRSNIPTSVPAEQSGQPSLRRSGRNRMLPLRFTDYIMTTSSSDEDI